MVLHIGGLPRKRGALLVLGAGVFGGYNGGYLGASLVGPAPSKLP